MRVIAHRPQAAVAAPINHQRFVPQQFLATDIMQEDGFPAIPAAQDEINGPFVCDSELSRHRYFLRLGRQRVMRDLAKDLLRHLKHLKRLRNSLNREGLERREKSRPFPRNLSGFAYFAYFAVHWFRIAERNRRGILSKFVHSPDNHCPDCFPAFSIHHPRFGWGWRLPASFPFTMAPACCASV
jgi:hypothetical protein